MLTMLEEVVLLAVDEKNGQLRSTREFGTAYALVGAIFFDLALARKIFAKLDHGQLRYMTDPDNVLEPPLKYMTNLISGDALAYYPTGYWYGRLQKLW